MQYSFEDCVLDLDRRELMRASHAVAIGPQVFDLLAYLVQNRDRVVTKDGLLDAVWAGRVVSESTLTSHINAVRKAIGDSGAEQRVVRTIPRKGFRFVADVREDISQRSDEPPAITAAERQLTLPDKPSIAILPFHNLSGDQSQTYFVDGVVEDIITALSRARWLFVIARTSSFTYRDKPVELQRVGQELGVRYILEGSFRKAGERIRITAQLIEASTGTHLWGDKFEGTLDDIFELQDKIAANVAGAIAPQVELAEIERAKRKPTSSLGAYDFYLHGLSFVHKGSREAMTQALPMFRKAIELDADFASAHALAAWCYFWRRVNGWSTDGTGEATEGERLARRAVELGRDDAIALTRGGHSLAHFTRDVAGGIALLDRATFLNPNLASAWFLGGFLRVWWGEPENAIELFERATRLSPVDPELYRIQAGLAMAHFLAGRFEVSTVWAEESSRNLPSFLLAASIVAASNAMTGKVTAAARAMTLVRDLDPTLHLTNLGDWLPFCRPADLARFGEALRRAGLPEC